MKRSFRPPPLFRFFKKGIILLFIIGILDLIIGRTLQHFYFTQESGLLYRTNYAMFETMAEAVVLGSSRANHHYVPSVFEECLGMSFYNSGRDGNFLLYNWAVLNAILDRYKPRIIILDINPNELYYSANSYERLATLLPYVKFNKEIRNLVWKRSMLEPIKLLSSIYPYNSYLLTIAIGNLDFNMQRKSDDQGYIPLYKEMVRKPVVIENSDFINDQAVDFYKVEILERFNELCERENILFYLVSSPTYCLHNNTSGEIDIKKMLFDNKLNYKDFSRIEVFQNITFFADAGHLNHYGAVAFSGMVCDSLRNENQER